MKIKCPSCNWDDDNVINWAFHVEKHPYKALTNYFHLQKKIHEKIEELGKSDDGYDKMFLTEVQKLLKSLLEKES